MNCRSELVQCHRCGTWVKSSFIFEGKAYGSTCIARILGHPLNWAALYGRVYDPDRYAQEQADFRAKIEIQKRELTARTIHFTKANSWLINILIHHPGDFCQSIAEDIKSKAISELPSRALYILADIYGKEHGRRNSKAYEKAHDEFWEKIEQEN